MTPQRLEQVATLRLQTTDPFDFRHSLWKPSHFQTGLELHTADVSWRTFRMKETVIGARFEMRGTDLEAALFAELSLAADETATLAARFAHAYGLHDNLSGFLAFAERVPAMAEPLAALCGMRQSCPETLFEIAIISLLLQNATIQRTTQMMRNLLNHYGRVVEFDGVVLRAFFTPREVMSVPEDTFRTVDRLGYRAKYIGRFAEFFADLSDLLVLDEHIRSDFLKIKGVEPYTAAIVDSHASRDPAALGLDVWNRKIFAKRLLGVDDSAPEHVRAACDELFPGYAGLAALYP